MKLSAKKKEKMICRMMAYDICAVLDDCADGDLSYLTSILTGVGWTQYNNMTDEDLLREWERGNYDGPMKKSQVETSPQYNHPYVKRLWDKGRFTR